jgi:hypothetical protein
MWKIVASKDVEGVRNTLDVVLNEIKHLQREVQKGHMATKTKFDEIAARLEQGEQQVEAGVNAILAELNSTKEELVKALAAGGISAEAEDAVAARFDSIADKIAALGAAIRPS